MRGLTTCDSEWARFYTRGQKPRSVHESQGSAEARGAVAVRGASARIGCLWNLRDVNRQAWHDKMAGTFVVKVPRH